MFKLKAVKKNTRKKERNINPNLPAQLMEGSCLLMDDMLFPVTFLLSCELK